MNTSNTTQKENKAKTKSALRRSLAILTVFISLAFWVIQFDSTQKLYIGQGSLNVEIVDTIQERRNGLSGRDSLAEDSGMFFIFDNEGYHGIWMKDMKFSIDIAWLDEEFRVVHVEQNVSPNTFPADFKPTVPAKYVLETRSGWLAENGVEVGSAAKLD